MTKLQKILTTMLDKFDKKMLKSKIKWSLFGGNALGAVRHGGWIPWDDDLDIVIMAEDRKKFIEIFKDDKDFTLELPMENNCNNLTFIKLYSKKYFYQSIKNSKEVELPLWIDVFTLVKSREPKRSLWWKFWANYVFARNNVLKRKTFNILKSPLKIIPLFLIRKIILKPLENNKGIYNLEDTKHFTEYLKGTDFSKIVRVKYENYSFPIFSNPKVYVEHRYGKNWNIIPEEKDREVHNIGEIIIK